MQPIQLFFMHWKIWVIHGTQAIILMEEKDFNSKTKKNNSLTLKKHADCSFNNFAVQKLVFLK